MNKDLMIFIFEIFHANFTEITVQKDGKNELILINFPRTYVANISMKTNICKRRNTTY